MTLRSMICDVEKKDFSRASIAIEVSVRLGVESLECVRKVTRHQSGIRVIMGHLRSLEADVLMLETILAKARTRFD